MKELFLGVDLHKQQFTCYYLSNNNETGKYMKYLTDEKGYKLFLENIQFFKNNGYSVKVGVESTGNTRYFKNRVESIGANIKVINTLRFKVVNETINKTDKKDAKTIAEFLKKDILPEAKLCSDESEELRRIVAMRNILVQTNAKLKNKIHGSLLGMGINTKSGQLNSKKGRHAIIDRLKKSSKHELTELFIKNIEDIAKNVKQIEEKIENMTKKDRTVEILKSIPGTGTICAVTVRSHIDNIKRFKHYKKLSSFSGLVPWVKCSDKKIYYGNITKHGPSELRTAIIQMVLGMIRCKNERDNILMIQYRNIKKRKGSGKALVAIARKFTKLIWTLLTRDELFNSEKLSKENYLDKIISMQEKQFKKDAA